MYEFLGAGAMRQFPTGQDTVLFEKVEYLYSMLY
jgi:hypothetical protein